MGRGLKNILVTGGAGFIGSNFIRYLFEKTIFSGRIINLDKLTYAGNLDNLKSIDQTYGNNGMQQYIFVRGDVTDQPLVTDIFQQYEIDTVVHFAAESHVDRSINSARPFVETNITGTLTLLECAYAVWGDRDDVLFHHISTDEVYGSLGAEGYFYEETPYAPRNPYAASKAASDHMVMAFHHTHHLPITLSNCSNNYGPYQFPEKLIPLMILKMQQQEKLPIYGDGKQIRDWLYVEDHCHAIWLIINDGKVGRTYNIGGENEWSNIDLLHQLITLFATETATPSQTLQKNITHITDRKGHDRRYAINCDRIKSELKWFPKTTFEEGLLKTVRWYLTHPQWIKRVQSGAYQQWLESHYTL